MEKNKPYISVEDVAMWYPHKTDDVIFKRSKEKQWIKAVDGVNLHLDKGEILGVIGESGCGKSTLGRILTRLENPTRGDVYIGGVSTSEMLKKDPKSFRSEVQIVFQNPFDTFTPRDTISKILMRPLKNYKIGKDEAERRQICLKALESGGLRPAEDIMNRYPHELSGGQLQRISIIRAMFLNPSFVIADEPVSMLDVSVRADIINMLIDLSKNHDAAVVFISHDIALTRYISHNIAVMYLGRIVEYGSADDVVKNPQHPYTQALISNCASIDPDEKTQIIAIDGEPPTPLNPGPGCYFAPRCFKACPDCLKKYPETHQLGNGHYAVCDRIGQESDSVKE